MVHILPTIFDTFHKSDSCIAGGCWSGTGVYTSRSQLAAAALRSAAHASEDRSTPPQVQDWAVLKRGSNVAKNLMTSAAAGKKGKWRNAHSSEDWSPQEKLTAFWQHYCGWTNGQKLAKNVTFWDPCPSFSLKQRRSASYVQMGGRGIWWSICYSFYSLVFNILIRRAQLGIWN